MKKFGVKHILGVRETKDYSSAILFLLLSSFFIVVVIRPVLGIAVSLQREGEDLRRINDIYRQNIGVALQLQAGLEQVRAKEDLINSALPNKPHVEGVIADVRRAAEQSGITVYKASVQSVDIKNPEIDAIGIPQKLNVQIQTNGDFATVNSFVHAIAIQKRIKSIDSLTIVKSNQSADNKNISLQINLVVYYLPEISQEI